MFVQNSIVDINIEKKKKRYKNRSDEDILKAAKEDMDSWFDFFADNIERYRDDYQFAFVGQWDDQAARDRFRKHKSVLEFNQLNTHIMQVVGAQRQNTPSAKVRANFKDADQKMIDIREGLLRQVEFRSRSDIAYQTCFKSQLSGGFGAIQVDIDYESSESFELEPKIYRIEDPTTCFWDPYSKDVDKGDGKFCGQYINMPRKEFEKRYPDVKQPASFPNSTFVSSWTGWGNSQTITIADYYCKEFYKETIVELSDGRTMPLRDAEVAIAEYELMMSQQMINENNQMMPSVPVLSIERKKKVEKYRIMHYKMVYDEIIDRSEWPSELLPFIYVDGDSDRIDGEQLTRSYIHFAKDAQRQYNYVASEMTDALVHSQRSQWIASPEQVSTQEQQLLWTNPEIHGVLMANKDKYGQFPEKTQPFTLAPTLFQMLESSQNDMTNILGRYQANLGAQGNETSGVAIANRVKQGNVSTFIYFDNLNRGIQSVQNVILSLIPRIYDSTRDVVLRNDDGAQKIKTLNKPMPFGQVENQIDDSSYSVEVSVGPSYETQKSQALDQLINLARVNPQVFPLIADLIAENFDLENMPQLVERLKNMVPPQVLAKESGDPIPPQQPTQPSPQEMMMKQEMQLKEREMQLKEQQLQQNAIKIQQDQEKIDATREGNYLKAGVENDKVEAEMEKARMEENTEHTKMLKDFVSEHLDTGIK